MTTLREASAKRGTKRALVELKRLPDGTFAPKGRGQMLHAGMHVSVPHKSGHGSVRGVVKSKKKVALVTGPDVGMDVKLADGREPGGSRPYKHKKGADGEDYVRTPDGTGKVVDYGGGAGATKPYVSVEIDGEHRKYNPGELDVPDEMPDPEQDEGLPDPPMSPGTYAQSPAGKTEKAAGIAAANAAAKPKAKPKDEYLHAPATGPGTGGLGTGASFAAKGYAQRENPPEPPMSPGTAGLQPSGKSIKDLPLGTTVELADGNQYIVHKAVGDPWMIVKPVGGGKAKPMHKMAPAVRADPSTAYEGSEDYAPESFAPGYTPGAAAYEKKTAPGAPASTDDLMSALTKSVDVAEKAKASGQQPKFKVESYDTKTGPSAEQKKANAAKMGKPAPSAPPRAPEAEPPDLSESPGRGPTGKMRNFKAMNKAKLLGVIQDLKQFGGDDEALNAAHAVAADKGYVSGGPKAGKPKAKTKTEKVKTSDGGTTIQSADPNPPSPGPTAKSGGQKTLDDVPSASANPPAAVNAALAAYKAAGGSDPTVIEMLKKAGGL